MSSLEWFRDWCQVGIAKTRDHDRPVGCARVDEIMICYQCIVALARRAGLHVHEAKDGCCDKSPEEV